MSVAKGHRYLEDASGRPFLMTGDAAWSLIGDLSREEADTYLADRQQRGFNTILVSLIEHRFSRNAPRNFYKHAPFREGGAFSNPNDAYFDDADWILRRAAERGFLVLLVPSYLGVNGGPEGWFHEVEAAGAGAMRSYGRYLGKRYRDFSNIVWVQGGDYDTPDKSLVEALAEGMAEVDPKALQTIHRGPETVGSEIWHDADWLKLDTLYAYQDVAARAEKRHLDGPALPFVFLEGPYENERGSDEQSLRANAYGAILSGACGQVFGNNPVWHFGGPGLYEQSTSWQDSLASRGAQSMTHLKAFFSSLPWWTLEPDRGALLAQGSSPSEGLVASRSPGGDLAVVYSAGARHIVLKASGLPSSGQRARWFDPSSGRFSPAIANGPAKAGTIEYITPHERNSAGFSDWLLVVTGPR